MLERALTLMCIVAGTLLTYMAGHDIYWDSGVATLVAYTIGVLALGAGIRSIVKE
jgi:hypothetical protein